MKKLVVAIVFIFAVASLSSCRSKKSSCDYGSLENQTTQQEIVTCVE